MPIDTYFYSATFIAITNGETAGEAVCNKPEAPAKVFMRTGGTALP